MVVRYREQLVDLMKEIGLPLIACECGTAEGLFANTLMLRGIQKFYLVDKWEYTPGQYGDGGFSQEWHQNNLLQVQDRMLPYKNSPQSYTILQGDTVAMAEQVPDNSLGMVYIDADHSYEGVLRDIEAYYPKLVTGGVMAFHDYLSPDYGVQRAVEHWCTGSSYPLSAIIIIPEHDIMDAGAYFIKH